MAIRVLLVDDHEMFRQGLSTLLKDEPDVEVVGEAEDGATAIRLARELGPDLIIMDVDMPGMTGIDAARRILPAIPDVKLLALSTYLKKAFVVQMLKAGASAHILKECVFQELVEAVRAASRGETYLCRKINRTVMGDYVRLLSNDTSNPLEELSTREREVLQLLAEGKSAKQIALSLHMSTKAIEATRRKSMEKLDADSVAKLVKLAIIGGITSLE